MTATRIAVGIEYAGESFCGWQSQPTVATVQDTLEAAFGRIAGQPVRLHCAGRTDSGVHATAQVAHFDCSARRSQSAWVRGVNSLLPRSIGVRWAQTVAADFHARYSARRRHYRYVLQDGAVRPALLAQRVGWFHQPLNVAAMQAGAALLCGEHDFSAFRAAGCQARSPRKTLYQADVARVGDLLVFDFVANAFLQHMVRNLVGTLVYIGAGRLAAEVLPALLASGERRLAAPTFAPDGLYFCGVDYDACWGLRQKNHWQVLPAIGGGCL